MKRIVSKILYAEERGSFYTSTNSVFIKRLIHKIIMKLFPKKMKKPLKVKKVNLLYDTEKANIISKREYLVFSETLYRTKKGNYFLDIQYSDSKLRSGIRPLTDTEAFEWLAKYDPDKAVELFPDERIEEA